MRAIPGATGELLATMPLDALAMVELGPLPLDGYDWYQVRYNFLNPSGVAESMFGWVAFGPRATPWLTATDGVRGWYSGIFAGGAGTGPDVAGPVEVGNDTGVRWAAVGQDCPLVISLGDVPIVSTTVDGFAEDEVALGSDNPGLVGTLEIAIESECSWTFSVLTYQG